jgi:uncharacterized protein (DUF58 family)
MKEFSVNIAPLIKKLELLSRKGISGFLSGGFRSFFKGRGLEFHDFRLYNPAEDDAKFIDWKTSLRSKDLVVKELIEERNNNVLFMIDTSSTMSFSSTELLKNEYVIELFATMAYSFIEGGDSVGVALFNNKVVKYINPNIGSRQFYNLIRTVTSTQYYEGEYDLENAIVDFTSMTQKKCILFIISDFIGLKGDWKERLKILCSKHEVIIFVVRDPRDLFMPESIGQVFVQEPATGETLLIDTKMVKKDYEAYMQNQNKHLERVFNEAGAEYTFMTTADPISKTLISFFRMRMGR